MMINFQFRSLPFKRPGLSWDTMTDEEREEAQRLRRFADLLAGILQVCGGVL